MASIAIQFTKGAQSNARSLTIGDTDIDVVIQAFQSDANVAVNGTATRGQVVSYIAGQFAKFIQTKVQNFQKQPEVVPPPISVT